jgi:hypothetical protein
MILDNSLLVVQTRAALLGERVMANDGWLAGGFLSDERFTPQGYLHRAERQRQLRRALYAMTERLLMEAPLPFVA